MLWTMSATQAADNLGPELVGRRWTVEGMSYLIFDGLTVVREADYHDAGSRERSLRLPLASGAPLGAALSLRALLSPGGAPPASARVRLSARRPG